jgi:hypothetical protein
MKKLELNQMEILLGGQTQSAADANDISDGKMTWGCAGAIFGTALAFAGLVTATGGAGLVIAAISMSTAPMSLVACG